MTDDSLQFQQNLISKRKKQGLTLQELAARSEVSKSIISKIEHAQVQPTIETASRIANGLGSTLANMLYAKPTGTVIHHPASQQLTHDNGNHVKRVMSPPRKRARIEVFLEHLSMQSNLEGSAQPDSEKYILALDDGLSVKANENTYALAEGDCIHLERKVNYCLRNSNDTDVKFITILHRRSKFSL